MFEQLNFERLSECFNQWATEQMGIEAGDWLAVDGKSIKGTVEQAHSSYQSFVNLVSVYSQRQGVVVALQQFENAQESEIKVVEALLTQLGVPGRVERTPEMFRLALYSPLLSPFGTRECHKIQPCTLGSLPLTEACLRFSRTSLFIRSFTRWD
ncbi:hypothetical protein C7B65_23975 [Phormidesmis priestleyi ULC007]|uniref:ISAs1 family transposase n=1 Tax=Phormidesmis priestleyi ULC007 TaxID=1920490 RepID=A0A2T1D5D8_9CYAN|nr:hypothetical protein C7B65_23975 [Phormidesmis priestleyi ULC007]